MSGPSIGLAVLQPADGAVVSPGRQVSAARRAAGKAGFEPVLIDRATLSVDGGPAAEGSLTQIPHEPVPTFSWTASIQAPTERGSQQIVVTIQDLGGLLGVETDSRCVPHALQPPFGDVVRPGDRIAMLGRWIVDAGHSVAVPPGQTPQLPGGGTSYRSEVHPPLLMATGGLVAPQAGEGG